MQLTNVLTKKLEKYNNQLLAMPLVIFNQMVEHICHILSIIQKPAGYALLLRVKGSVKQSISNLSVFLYEIFYLLITIKGN